MICPLNRLLDLGTLQKYDTLKMYEIYDNWPTFASEYYNKKVSQIDIKNVEHIVFAGMGGSGVIGDIFSAIFSKTDIHVSIVKGYHLPNTVNSNTLVITTSVSGNTIETLTVLESAKKINAKIVAFSGRGKLEEYCKKFRIEHQKIPLLHSPRASLTAYLYTALNVLMPILPITKVDVIESITKLEEMKKKISSSNLTESNHSLNLAEWINGIPLIYYPYGLQAAATRFKNSLQENAKMHAIAEDVIEASHNGIVSWEKPSNVQPILLQGKDDYIKTKERWKILKEYFRENNVEYKEICSIEGNIFSKIITLIYLLDYSTIYLAIMSKTDPSPVRSIDFMKQRLSTI